MERKLAAILAADVVGYSRLMGEDEVGTLTRLKSLRRELVQPKIAEGHGRIVKFMGDGLLAEFPSVVEAVKCGVDIQQNMAGNEADQPDERRISLRIGVNLGDVIVEGSDIYGDGVNVAARLEGLAEPGGICVSGAVADQIQGKVDVSLIDMGEVSVKNINRPIKTYYIDTDGVQVSDTTATEPLPQQCRGLNLPMPSRPSVILIPFKDLSAGGELAYMAEGIRIDVQCALVKISGLFVIAAGTGAAVYGNREATPEQVSREMGVQYVLEGSVRGNAERLRVTAQLSDGTNGQVLWSEQYDRVVDDSFIVQDEIAQKIVTSMDVKLVSGEQAKVWRKTLRNPKALELYYRALESLEAFDKQSVADGRRMAERVTEISPDVALGPTLVAFCHYWDATMGWSDDIEVSLDRASEWAARAAAMDDATGEAHIILAHVLLLRGNHDEAEAIAEEAVEIRPQCANTNALFANILVYCGKPENAIERVKLAIRYAPAYASWWVEILAAAYRDAAKYDLAVAAAKEAARLRPESANAYAILASALVAEGNEAFAREAVSQLRDVDSAYSLQTYSRTHPYRDSSILDFQLAQLRQAGLED